MANQDDITHQQTLLATHRRNLAHYLNQQAILGVAHAPPVVAHGIREARENIQRIKGILRSWNVPVDDQPDDTDAPAAFSSNTPSNPPAAIDRTTLRQILNGHFSDDEIQELCFDLKIDYENLNGQNKTSKILALITYVERRGRYAELVKHVRFLRPHAQWQ